MLSNFKFHFSVLWLRFQFSLLFHTIACENDTKRNRFDHFSCVEKKFESKAENTDRVGTLARLSNAVPTQCRDSQQIIGHFLFRLV